MTRQYARRQLRWLRRRFLDASSARPPVYSVSSDDPARWDEDCLDPAQELVRAALEGRQPDRPPEKAVTAAAAAEEEDDMTLVTCQVCQRDFVGTRQMRAHLAGRRHKNVVAR